jgi:hypothetical protein
MASDLLAFAPGAATCSQREAAARPTTAAPPQPLSRLAWPARYRMQSHLLLAVLVALRLRVCLAAAAVVTAELSPDPLLSGRNPAGKGRCTAASFCFNAAFVPASAATQHTAGILVRLRNHTGGQDVGPSKLGYATLRSSGKADDVECDDLAPDGIVFGPEPGLAVERNGTEDPRVAYDERTGVYHLTYTAFEGRDKDEEVSQPPYVALHLATSTRPAVPGSWERHGPAFRWLDGHIQTNHTKSGAMLIGAVAEGPHYMIYLHTLVSSAFVATSEDLRTWRPLGTEPILAPRAGRFDSHLTEPGPPPLPLSDGSWIFFYNGSAENEDNATKIYDGCIKVSQDPARPCSFYLASWPWHCMRLLAVMSCGISFW